MTDGLKWEATGGCNDDKIGGNANEFSYTDENGEKHYIQVDYGALFSKQEKTGYDSFLPVQPHCDDILITHGHADHIAGLKHLINLRREEGKKLTLHCSPYSMVMIQSALRDTAPEDFPEFHIVEPDKPFEINGFKIEPFAVSHSIPDALGFVVESPDGVRMMTTGDFKTADVPLGHGWNDEKIAAIAKKGIDVLFLDSTSATNPGMTKGEADVRKGVKDVMDKSEGGMIVSSMMASSAHRIYTIAQGIADHCRETGAAPRTIITDGGAFASSRAALERAGYDLEKMILEETGVPVRIVSANTDEAKAVPPAQRLYLCTGSQGEKGTFREAAEGVNPNFSLDEAKQANVPVFVYNFQSCIPGNEETWEDIQNKFREQGCTVEFPVRGEEEGLILHCSGHGGREDIVKACRLVAENSPRPTMVIPVHGSTEQRKNVMKIAQENGMKACIVQNCASVAVKKDGSKTFSAEPVSEKWIGVINDGDFKNPVWRYENVTTDVATKAVTKQSDIAYKPAPEKPAESKDDAAAKSAIRQKIIRSKGR